MPRLFTVFFTASVIGIAMLFAIPVLVPESDMTMVDSHEWVPDYHMDWTFAARHQETNWLDDEEQPDDFFRPLRPYVVEPAEQEDALYQA